MDSLRLDLLESLAISVECHPSSVRIAHLEDAPLAPAALGVDAVSASFLASQTPDGSRLKDGDPPKGRGSGLDQQSKIKSGAPKVAKPVNSLINCHLSATIIPGYGPELSLDF